ncbi:hypothetical protein B0533_13475 [Sedimentibacter sp. SX930]|nr:hypothetical protein B0533_13475 [Sedimentibacter sp. SX930]
MINIIEFFTLAFPKAGILIGGIPVTVALVFFGIWILFHMNSILKIIMKKNALGFEFIVFAVIVFFTIIANLNTGMRIPAAEGILYVVSPLMIAVGYRANKEEAIKIITVALLIVGTFSIIQYVIGIERTMIAGLTLTYGDSYFNKTIGFGFDGLEAIKMPSTYQAGNSAGIFYILSSSVLLANKDLFKSLDKKMAVMRNLALCVSLIAIFMSGSRSVIISLILVCPYLYKGIIKQFHGREKTYFKIILIIIMIYMVIYFINSDSEFISRIINRYVKDTLNDPTASGRTVQWTNFFSIVSSTGLLEFIRFILVGLDWKYSLGLEGFLYVMPYYGVLAFFLFIKIMIRPLFLARKVNMLYFAGFLGVFIILCIDRTFCSTPTLMNYFLIYGIVLKEYEELNLKLSKDNKMRKRGASNIYDKRFDF